MPTAPVFWLLGVASLTARFSFATRLDNEALLQSRVENRLKRPALKSESSRISIVDGKLMKGGVEVLPLGANYNVKGPPYYPPPEVVAGDAKYFADGVASMKYKPSDGRQVVPVVRLSTYLEGAMPTEPGVFDTTWKSRLEATVQAFADEGVHVFLDIHQDALSASTGGEGLPVWMLNYMQENHPPGCGRSEDWCKGMWYTATPERPLELVSFAKHMGNSLKCVENCTGDGVPANAWLAYSARGNAGDPTRMNVGNINMKANTFNMSWNGGLMVMTKQVSNAAWRFYRAYKYDSDKKTIFDPYMSLVRYLVSVWERYPNVIGIDLLNEPPFGGLTDLEESLSTRTDLYGMYAQVLSELDADATPTKAIFLFEDVGAQNCPVANWWAKRLSPANSFSIAKLTNWTRRGQLMYEFHWYPGQNRGDHSVESLKSSISEAVDIAKTFGHPPLYLGEFQIFSAKAAEPLTIAGMTAYWLAQAGEILYRYGGATYGIKAATYWEYANSTFTGNDGWCKTPEGVTLDLFEGISHGHVDLDKWKRFEQTVADGTSWGACITGFYPAIGPWAGNVLAEVPAV